MLEFSKSRKVQKNMLLKSMKRNFVEFRCKVKGLLSSNLKSSYSYSVNDEKFILQLKLEPAGKFLIGEIVG